MPDWPYIPGEISEILEFDTLIRQTPQSEQRESLHDAVQILDYSYDWPDAQATHAEILFNDDPLATFTVPLYADAHWETGALDVSDQAGITTATDADFRVGQSAVFQKTYLDAATHTVAAVGAGTIDLSAALGVSFAASDKTPTLVCPALPMDAITPLRLSKQYAMTRANVTFRSQEAADLGTNNYPTFSSLPVMTDENVQLAPLNATITRAAEQVGNRYGSMRLQDLRDITERTYQLTMNASTSAQRWALREWLHYLRGRAQAFWIPTWKRDLTLADPIAAIDTTMDVNAAVGDVSQLVGEYINIRHAGADYQRQITAAVDVASQQRLTFSPSLGAAIPVTALVSFMLKVRLDTDRPTIRHRPIRFDWYSTFSAAVREVVS